MNLTRDIQQGIPKGHTTIIGVTSSCNSKIDIQCDGVKEAIIASMKNNTNLDFVDAT